MIVESSAIAQLTKTLDPGAYFRVGVQAGGCNGFEKQFDVCDKIESDDVVLEGLVVVDATSYAILEHSTLCYQQDLSGNRFDLKIPEAASQCGCGMSFDFK